MRTVLRGRHRYRIRFCWTAADIERIRKRTRELIRFFAGGGT